MLSRVKCLLNVNYLTRCGTLNDLRQVVAVMVLIVTNGFVVDGLVFRVVERRLCRSGALPILRSANCWSVFAK
jgi:hypothetical protein